jgi:hypothetical protein
MILRGMLIVIVVRRIFLMSDYGLALGVSFFFLVIFVAGFWLGVAWQERRDA